jgi:multidrug efflux system membrane fusion protein
MNAQIPLEKAGVTSPLRSYLIGGMALALLLGGFWYFNKDSAKRPVRSTAVPVRVAKVTRRDMAVVEHTLGSVVANSTVQISARVTGVIDSAAFKEGQFVKKGDLLFVIDPRPYQAAYDNAVATLASAKAKADRYQKLVLQNAISSQDEDDAQAAYLVAKSNAEAARLNLEFTRIRAPVDGKTGPMLVQAGNMVSATAMTPLVTIDQIHPIKVSFSLPQSDLGRIQARQRSKGLTAAVSQQDQASQTFSAPVDFISNAVNKVSGTIELRSTFTNQDETLVPDQLVNVTVELNNIPGALVVPREAVNVGPDGEYVFAIKGKKVVEKPVSVLFDNDKDMAVTGDLIPGEEVVVDGQMRLVPGATVLVEGAPRTGAGDGAGAGGPKRRTGKKPT